MAVLNVNLDIGAKVAAIAAGWTESTERQSARELHHAPWTRLTVIGEGVVGRAQVLGKGSASVVPVAVPTNGTVRGQTPVTFVRSRSLYLVKYNCDVSKAVGLYRWVFQAGSNYLLPFTWPNAEIALVAGDVLRQYIEYDQPNGIPASEPATNPGLTIMSAATLYDNANA